MPIGEGDTFVNLQLLEEETKKRPKKLFEERVTENIPNLRKEIDIQVQQGQRVPNKLKPKRHTQRYITIKMAKVKDRERILQAAREKQVPAQPPWVDLNREKRQSQTYLSTG